MSAIGVEKYIASPATVAMTALTGTLASELDYPEIFPFEVMPVVETVIEEYDDRLSRRVWNYADVDDILCEQLFPERWTYHISIEKSGDMLLHLLEGLDDRFAGLVKPGDIMLAGENFGRGKLIKHAAVGLVKAGVKAVIAKSVCRSFFRMAANHGLLILIIPALVDRYRMGDSIQICPEEGYVLFNEEKYPLPKIHPDFWKMIEDGGI